MTLTEAALTEEPEGGWLCGRCGAGSGGDDRCAECGAVLVSRHFPRMRRRLGPAVAATAVLAVVAAVATVATAAGRGDSPAPAAAVVRTAPAVASPVASPVATPAEERARLQAEAVDRVLAGSAAARSGLVDAIVDVRMCRTSGLSVIASVTEARRDQLAYARALEVDALDGGEAVQSFLVHALNTSYRADAAFLTWGSRYVRGGCSGPVEQDGNYRRGVRLSGEADTAKTRFTVLWNPIATSFGLKERSRTAI